MTQQDTDHSADDEDLNVKKDRPPVRPVRLPVGPARRALFMTSELFRGLSLASADGFRAFSNAVDPEVTVDEDFADDLADATIAANRQYVKDVTAQSRRFFDGMMDEGRRMAGYQTPDIDYDKLAKKVAEEMRKSAEAAPAPTGTKPKA